MTGIEDFRRYGYVLDVSQRDLITRTNQRTPASGHHLEEASIRQVLEKTPTLARRRIEYRVIRWEDTEVVGSPSGRHSWWNITYPSLSSNSSLKMS